MTFTFPARYFQIIGANEKLVIEISLSDHNATYFFFSLVDDTVYNLTVSTTLSSFATGALYPIALACPWLV